MNLCSLIRISVAALLVVDGFVGVTSRSGYLLTLPQEIQKGAEERFCLTLYNVTGDFRLGVNVSCYGREVHREEDVLNDGSNSCFVWKIPESLTAGTCDLRISGSSRDYEIREKRTVEVVDSHQITFIQTDKPVYKPGDTVRFRILTVTQDLLPVVNEVGRVTVVDPNGVYMKQWTDLPVQAGLLSLDYRLYDEPVLGDWKIEAEVNGRTTQQNFTILKYVLPRFQVQATLPDSLTVATKVMSVKVCARFTFGKPVEGFLNASVCLHNMEPNWFCIEQQRPCVSIQSKIDGCHAFDIETSLLNITLRKYSLLCKPQIRLVANVTEKNSGIVVRETFDGVGVWEERVRMQIHANKHFKPFFPYMGKVYVWKPDGSPAVSEDISLHIDQLGITVTLTTDSTGHAHFTLHNLTTSTTYFVINAQTLDSENTDQKLYTIYPAKTKRHVKQWFSPTLTYVDLSVTPRKHRNCGDNVNINMAFSEGPDAQIVAAYYQLISKGNILKIEDVTDNIRFSRKYTMKTQGTVLTPKKPVQDEESSEEEPDLEENVAVAGPPHLGTAFGPPGIEGGSMGPPGSSGGHIQAEAEGRAQKAPIESLGLDESKVCENGRYIDTITAVQQLRECNIIKGPLVINFLRGSNIGEELERSLAHIVEVTDYISITHAEAPLSLHFFKSLSKISGEKLYKDKYILYIYDNSNLEELFPENVAANLTLGNGTIHFQDNHKLCYNKIAQFAKAVGHEDKLEQGTDKNNGDDVPCDIKKLELTLAFATPHMAFLRYTKLNTTDDRHVIGYSVNWKVAESQNISIYKNRDACSNDVWHTKEICTEVHPCKDTDRLLYITLLQPWTQYAAYIEAITVTKAVQGAISDILYFRTSASGAGTKIDDSSIKRQLRPPSQREFTISIVLSEVMTPRVRMLVYAVTDSGEVAADSFYLDILHCHRNKVEMSFDKGNARPGEPVEMTITARPNSLCTASMVDKGVYLVGGVNLLLPQHLDDRLERYDLTSDFVNDWQYCSDTSVLPPDFSNAEGPSGYPGTRPLDDWLDSDHSNPLLRRRRSIMQYSSNMYDSLLAFKTAGVMVLSDLDLLTRPCLHSEDNLGPPYLPSDPKGPIPGPGGFLDALEPTEDPTDVRPPVTNLRKNFPETWLWDLYEVTSSGSVSFTQTMPDTVTQWVGNSLCLHESAGLGISDVAKVTGFQPFFVDVSLPYSVVRGENAEIKITVFNYLPHCIALQVDVRKQAWFTLLPHDDWQFCVCAGKSVANSYHLVPSQIGVHTLTISAFIREHRVSCRSNVAPPEYNRKQVTELVARKLIVEAEGLEEERTQSQFICPQDSPDGVLTLSLTPQIPSRDFIVNGSLRGWISIVGDIMGPALEGLADLIQLPTGCGEQNLVRLAPNIAILQYLTATSQLTEDVELRTLDHLNKGFQQQLKFMHKDGSYSAFGTADDKGSTWLSAFVFKTISQTENFIFIDRKQIQAKTWEFLLYQQGEDGCFYESGKVLSKYMMGGVGANKKGHKQALTAYVLVAMLESFQMMRERTPPFVALAIRCINVDDLNDTYTQALVAYAMALYKPQSKFTEVVINQLLEKAVKQDAMMFWRREYQPDILSGQGRAASAEVEMTSYVLLAILTKDEQAPISNVIPIVRWLASQRNSYGGFASTQDTVVALQALSLFSRRIYGSGLDVKVNMIDSLGSSRDFHVVPSNRIVLQRHDLANPGSVLKVSTKGEGCVMLQLTSRYNIENKVMKDDGFNLTVGTPVTMEILNKNCRRRPVSICASYLGNSGQSNMVVIEMKVPSGWQLDLDQLQNLLNSVELGMKKYEVDSPSRNTINFYFDQLDPVARCFIVMLWQEVRVDNQKLAVVKVYDYYETGEQTMTFYEMSACSLESVETIDVSIDSKSVAQIPDAVLKTEILEQPRSGDSSENAASTGEVEDPVGASAPKAPFKQTCPQCYITGTVDLMAKMCTRQVWIIEEAGNQSLTLQVMAADGVSPKHTITMPTGLLSCSMCEPFFAGDGLKSIVFLEPYDWHDLGANILQGSNQVIVWSESLQEALLGALKSCPRP